MTVSFATDTGDSTRRVARHHSPHSLLRRPRRNRLQGERNPGANQCSQLYVCTRDKGCKFGVPCLLRGRRL